jgi:hypothetical protein
MNKFENEVPSDDERLKAQVAQVIAAITALTAQNDVLEYFQPPSQAADASTALETEENVLPTARQRELLLFINTSPSGYSGVQTTKISLTYEPEAAPPRPQLAEGIEEQPAEFSGRWWLEIAQGTAAYGQLTGSDRYRLDPSGNNASAIGVQHRRQLSDDEILQDLVRNGVLTPDLVAARVTHQLDPNAALSTENVRVVGVPSLRQIVDELKINTTSVRSDRIRQAVSKCAGDLHREIQTLRALQEEYQATIDEVRSAIPEAGLDTDDVKEGEYNPAVREIWAIRRYLDSIASNMADLERELERLARRREIDLADYAPSRLPQYVPLVLWEPQMPSLQQLGQLLQAKLQRDEEEYARLKKLLDENPDALDLSVDEDRILQLGQDNHEFRDLLRLLDDDPEKPQLLIEALATARAQAIENINRLRSFQGINGFPELTSILTTLIELGVTSSEQLVSPAEMSDAQSRRTKLTESLQTLEFLEVYEPDGRGVVFDDLYATIAQLPEELGIRSEVEKLVLRNWPLLKKAWFLLQGLGRS